MGNNDLIVYEVPDVDTDLEIDFLDATSLDEIEEGIRSIEMASDLLALVQGVAIVKVEREELWRQAGFETLRAYRSSQLERLGMPKQTVSSRRRTAEGFLENRRLLGDMKLTGHVSKLALLSEALRKHDRREVLRHFKTDSFRAFKAWVRPDLIAADLPDVDLSIKDGRISVDGQGVMEFSPDIPPEEKDFVSRVLKAAYKARQGSCQAHVVSVYDNGEARAVDEFLKRYRAGK